MRLGAFSAPMWGFAADVDARIDHGKTAALPTACRILAASLWLGFAHRGWGLLRLPLPLGV